MDRNLRRRGAPIDGGRAMKTVCKALTIRGADGNHVSLSETPERMHIVLAIQQNDDRGRISMVRFDREQLRSFMYLRDELEINDEERTPTPPANETEPTPTSDEEI